MNIIVRPDNVNLKIIPDFKTMLKKSGCRYYWWCKLCCLFIYKNGVSKKMHIRMLRQAINISTFNAHIIYQKKQGKLVLSTSVLNLYSKLLLSMVIKSVERRGGQPILDENPLRLTERHFLHLIPATEKNKNKSN